MTKRLFKKSYSKLRPIRRIPVADFRLESEEKKAINKLLDSGRFSEGKKVREFEKKWSKFIGTKYCVITSSGMTALITGLTALKYSKKLPPKTKVITTPLTYIADSNALIMAGFEPVYVDVDPVTFGITPETIQSYLKQTKDLSRYAIILAVDLMGFPLKIDKISQLAKDYDLVFFEDASQAHGTNYQGKKVGSQSSLAAFSFYAAHTIQAVELGALMTNDEEIFQLARKIKTQGRRCQCEICTRPQGKCPFFKNQRDNYSDPRFTHDLIGYNFKTTEFQAVLALNQLKKINKIIKKRQENVRFLNKRLKKYSDILQIPPYSNKVSYLAYPLVIKKPEIIQREQLQKQLENFGIETRPLFGCIPTQQPAYAYLRKKYKGKLPHAEYLGRNGFYLGCHQYLTHEDLNYIISTFERILG